MYFLCHNKFRFILQFIDPIAFPSQFWSLVRFRMELYAALSTKLAVRLLQSE